MSGRGTGLGLSLVPGQGVSWGLPLQGLCLLEGGERWRGGGEGNPEWPHFWLPTAPSPPSSTSVFPLPKAAPNGSSDLRFYLTVYATIAGVNSLCTLLRAILFAAGTLRAAATLHRRLLGRVLMVRGREGGGGLRGPSQYLGSTGGPVTSPSPQEKSAPLRWVQHLTP